jgi:hypothetical protein
MEEVRKAIIAKRMPATLEGRNGQAAAKSAAAGRSVNEKDAEQEESKTPLARKKAASSKR